MNKSDYQNKMHHMINDRIRAGIYKVTVDNTLNDLKTSYNGKYEHYEKMLKTL